MSGFGERFRRAGYTLPKPLIPVEGKPIIAHVAEMFPDEADFVFICNRDHLAESEFRMAETLRKIRPAAKIVPISPHKLGPVNAVLAARDAVRLDGPVIVNYCDFTCYWNYPDFKRFVTETACDGCVPAYRGFHPHSLGSTFYAYMKHTNLWMDDIQEKQPWTSQPTQEFASSGTYYFKSGQVCLDAFEKQMADGLAINGEFYASLAYRSLREMGGKTAIYELQHFMQWGTPEDLAEYTAWSNAFRRLAVDPAQRPRHSGALVVPMAGLGKRFADEGYPAVKPLIHVSGRPMAIQATRDLPVTPQTVFVLRKDIPEVSQIELKLLTSFVGTETVMLDGLTEGQAITCKHGLASVDPDLPVTVGACDNGMLYDAAKFEREMASDADVLVWVVRGHVDGRLRPKNFGWVEATPDGDVRNVLVKQEPNDAARDPMITGVFTFRRASDLGACVDALVARNGRVNGEFYVDSLINDAVQAGLKCRIFEIDHYLGWGTPNDLRTFEYWQSCFHKWHAHPYRLDKDRRIPASRVKTLAEAGASVTPARPAGVAAIAHDPAGKRTWWRPLSPQRPG